MANKEKDSKLDSEDKVSEENKEPETMEDKLAKMESELDKKDEEIQEYISHLQRLQADFENLIKQTEKKEKNIIKFANKDLIEKILDPYEDLGRALEKSNSEKELREGVELIYKKLKDTLKKEGVEEIPAEGEKFDSLKHDALLVENDPDVENGYIIQELMKGYTLKGDVIRYSKVKVCKK
ncbi:nucleotide exchange factor GrpE [Methanobrevibacter sp. 87.7]|uniref:nucleotide exchange factor GrpE n=1 Tax=Methanobrevibacter sp. 87.7 TaxID=387957 RepID=UPI000B50C635|nr:nucleotide exchange factor GrpE [Methanobrevibacter sp. 87.7]OWT33640.1 nucleotide exchange factor GrpE [Methanobrevibacter sp. 87.7]